MQAKLVANRQRWITLALTRPGRSIRSELVKETDKKNKLKERKVSLPSVIPSPSIQGSIYGSNLQAASPGTFT